MVRVMKVDGNQGIYNSFALNIGETPWEFHSKIRYCPPRRSSVGPSLGMLCGSDKSHPRRYLPGILSEKISGFYQLKLEHELSGWFFFVGKV